MLLSVLDFFPKWSWFNAKFVQMQNQGTVWPLNWQQPHQQFGYMYTQMSHPYRFYDNFYYTTPRKVILTVKDSPD